MARTDLALRPPPSAPDALRADLGGTPIGDDLNVAVMGVLNVSPESFFAASVVGRDRLRAVAEGMAAAGAALLDVGAMSTAPYGSGAIGAAEEADRLGEALRLLAGAVAVPLSADTSRAGPARAAVQAGARVINDVRGLAGDPELGGVVAGAGAGLILMASEMGAGGATGPGDDPVEAVIGLLGAALARAAAAGVPAARVVVDPGIGFFRRQAVPWPGWDCRVLAGLPALRRLGRPIAVGVSRKSFIGALAGAADPARRLPGSLAGAAAAVLGGAHLIRAHDVAETVQAVRVAQAIRRARGAAGRP